MRGSFGFPSELRTPPLPATHAEGGARPSNTCLKLRTRHQAGPPICESTRYVRPRVASFLTVDADNGLPCRFEDADLLVDVGELGIAVRVVRASFELLAVDVQRIVQLAQQAANRGWAERVASLFQADAQRPQAAAHPFLGAHRIAGCFRSDQRLQHGNDQRCFFSTAGRPPPGWRMRLVGCSTKEAANSSRPRRIVFSSTPVISNHTRSAPWPSRCDSTARYHLRCCSSNRLSSKFISRWYSTSRCSIPQPHKPHCQNRTTPVATLSFSSLPASTSAAPTLLPTALVPQELSQKPEIFLLQALR